MHLLISWRHSAWGLCKGLKHPFRCVTFAAYVLKYVSSDGGGCVCNAGRGEHSVGPGNGRVEGEEPRGLPQDLVTPGYHALTTVAATFCTMMG